MNNKVENYAVFLLIFVLLDIILEIQPFIPSITEKMIFLT